jgi:histidinol-phosphate aminotransferase
VVLAAGLGTRLLNGAPKPIRTVSGVPLIVRVLHTLEEVGIREAVIVLGHCGDVIRRTLQATPGLGLELRFVENDRYHAKNGVSLLAAKDYIDGECLLTMSDHLYSPELPRRLLAADLPRGACGLAVDRDIERCFDIDDATKVVTKGGRIVEIAKELPDYDAIDTGVFRIGPALIEELEAVVAKQGDASLSDGVRALAARGQFFACEVGDARWIDVDTPEAMERAEAMIRVFGDSLGDEPGSAGTVHPDAVELFAPTWVRAAKPYNEGHFAIADDRGDVLRMMSNESPFAPSARVIRAIVDAAMSSNHYPPNASRLKEKLAKRDDLDASNVILGAGSTELIDLVIRTFVAPGEEVLLSVPTFSMYEARTRVVGGIPVLVPMSDDHEHDINGLIRAVTERTKVLFLCTPNNPTGNAIPEAELRRLVSLGLPTVVDEAYVELGDAESYARFVREFPNVIVLRTFSKAFGLAGLRLGYAFAHSAVIELLSRVKIPWNLPAVVLAAAEAALEDSAEHEERVSALKVARAELAERLSDLPGLSILESDGNFISIDISSTGLSAADFVAAALAEGVLIRSLETHHATRRFVRVTVGTRAENARCVRALERVLSRRGVARLRLVAASSDAE